MLGAGGVKITHTVEPATVLTAEFDPQFYRVKITLTTPAPGWLTLFCSYDDKRWAPVRGATMVPIIDRPVGVYDWEVPLNGPSARYRAMAYRQVGDRLYCSPDYSNVVEASPPPKGEQWWLKDASA